MDEEREKRGRRSWATAGYYALAIVLVFVCYALFKMRTGGWPYFGPWSY